MDKIRIFIGLRRRWMYRNGLRVGDVALCCTCLHDVTCWHISLFH